MSLPAEQIVDAHKLTNDGVVFLYKIQPVTGGVVYVKADDQVTWQGNTYEGTAIQLSETSRNSDGELSRPTLTIANPLAVYSALVAAGTLDNAVITEKRVLRAHILSNSNIFSVRTWRVRRCPELNKIRVVLELRDSLDGQQFLLPGRMFIPPEFPSVSL